MLLSRLPFFNVNRTTALFCRASSARWGWPAAGGCMGATPAHRPNGIDPICRPRCPADPSGRSVRPIHPGAPDVDGQALHCQSEFEPNNRGTNVKSHGLTRIGRSRLRRCRPGAVRLLQWKMDRIVPLDYDLLHKTPGRRGPPPHLGDADLAGGQYLLALGRRGIRHGLEASGAPGIGERVGT